MPTSNKPKVLIVTEYSGLNVGYGVYANHILTGLHNAGVEFAELAVGVDQNYLTQFNTPWKVYPSIPLDPEEKRRYDSYPCADFGAYQFEQILLDYKPTVVADWRDCWHWEFQTRSPLRQFYAHIGMPAVDATPQNKQWIDLYESCDAVLGYTQWGMDLIKNTSPKIKVAGIAPPYAYEAYQPINNRQQLKQQLGLGAVQIMGMVGRNQKRKLYPDLFKAYRDFLDQTKKNDVYLYVHTSYPERGWDIDDEILKYGIQNKVLFGYICRKCRNIEVGLYQGPLTTCYHCGDRSKTLAGPECGFNHAQMAAIYNIMDLYIQWANCEGYGIPIMEAAACGTPVVAVDYSAMTEVTKNASGDLITPLSTYQELESGRHFAIPDNAALTKYMSDFFAIPQAMRNVKRRKTRKAYEENWKPDEVIKTWIDTINNVQPKRDWNEPARIISVNGVPGNLSNQDFVRWCIINILQEPERVGTWFETRLLRDLDWGVSPGGFGGEYYNELSASIVTSKMQPFNRDIMLHHFASLAEKKNLWEQERVRSL